MGGEANGNNFDANTAAAARTGPAGKSASAEKTTSADNTASPVLLVPAGCEVPAALVRAMAARRLSPVVVSDAPAVMTRLTEASRRIVVVIGDERVPHLSALTRAVERHYPRAAVWQLVRVGEEARLRPIVTPPSPREVESPGEDDATNAGGGRWRKLKEMRTWMTRRSRAGPSRNGGDAERTEPTNTVEPGWPDASTTDAPASASVGFDAEPATVSKAELAMLLGHAEPDADPGNGKQSDHDPADS